MGISKENLPNVFSRFWQADTSSQRQIPGRGNGLALVKELVEVQRGIVLLDSEVEKGDDHFSIIRSLTLNRKLLAPD